MSHFGIILIKDTSSYDLSITMERIKDDFFIENNIYN